MLLISNLTAVLFGLGLLVLSVNLTTIYLHRGVAHGSMRFKPWFDSVLGGMHVLLTGVRPRRWTAVHLYHHLFVDRRGDPGDPHSPNLEGVWRVIFFSVFYYAKATRDPRVWEHPVVQERLANIPVRASDRIGLWADRRQLLLPVGDNYSCRS